MGMPPAAIERGHGRWVRSEQLGVGLADGCSRLFVGTFLAAGLIAAGVVSARISRPSASDQSDYAPGASVALSGYGWAAGETVHIVVDDDQSDPWSHEADSWPRPTARSPTPSTCRMSPGRTPSRPLLPRGLRTRASQLLRRPTRQPTASPTLSSDKNAYVPGDAVPLSGTNWTPGSTVHVVVDDDKNDAWTHTANLVAGVDGSDQRHLRPSRLAWRRPSPRRQPIPRPRAPQRRSRASPHLPDRRPWTATRTHTARAPRFT